MARRSSGDWEDMTRMQKAGLYALIGLVVLFVVAFGLLQLWKSLINRREFLVIPGQIHIEDPWVSAEALRKDFLRSDADGLLKSQVSIFSTDLAQKVADAYLRSPWVKRVVSVRKSFPNTLDVRLDLRHPYVRVSINGAIYVLDEDGMYLHHSIYKLAGADLSGLGPVVALPSDIRLPRLGVLWRDPAVLGGISMLRLCKEQFAGKVASIEMRTDRAYLDKPAAVATLVMNNGPRVLWGAPPAAGSNSPAEIGPAEKTFVLLAIMRKEGANFSRIKEIDIRVIPAKVTR